MVVLLVAAHVKCFASITYFAKVFISKNAMVKF